MTERQTWSFFGVPLPVCVERETLRWYEEEPVTLSPEEARRRGEAALREQLERDVAPYGAVRSALCSARQRDGAMEVSLLAECEEEIGVRVPLYLNESG